MLCGRQNRRSRAGRPSVASVRRVRPSVRRVVVRERRQGYHVPSNGGRRRHRRDPHTRVTTSPPTGIAAAAPSRCVGAGRYGVSAEVDGSEAYEYIRGAAAAEGGAAHNARPATATPTVTHRGGNAVGLGGRAGREGPAREGGRGLEGRSRGEGASEDGGDLCSRRRCEMGSNLGVVCVPARDGMAVV